MVTIIICAIQYWLPQPVERRNLNPNLSTESYLIIVYVYTYQLYSRSWNIFGL